jgi:hypothetical protein
MPVSRRSRKVHGPVKELEMSRSVLPSSRRLEARRDLERARRRARRRVASQLRRYQGRVDSSLEAWLDHEVDVAWWPSAEIYGIVLERRDGDKIAPLIRWARARTRHLPQTERIAALQRALPPGVIGQHVRSHLQRCRDICDPMH